MRGLQNGYNCQMYLNQYLVVIFLFSITFCSSGKSSGNTSFQNDSLEIIYDINLVDNLLKTDVDSALLITNLACSKANNYGSVYLVTLTKDLKARVLIELGRWQEAISLFGSSIDTWNRLNRFGEKGESQLRLGGLYIKEGELFELNGNFQDAAKSYSLALKQFLSGLNAFQSSNSDYGIARAHFNIATSRYKLYQDSAAIYHYSLSSEFFEKVDSVRQQAMLLNNIGLIYKSSGRIVKSLNYLFQAREALFKTKDLSNLIRVDINIADLANSVDSLDSEYFLLEADSLSKLTDNLREGVAVKEHLSEFYGSTGQFEKAYGKLKEYVTIREDLLSSGFKSEELKVRYETAKQKQLIERQRAENLQQELELERASKLKASLIIGVLIAAGLIGLLLWRQRVKAIIQKQKEKIHQQEVEQLERGKKLEAASAMLAGQEKERVRIAEDLHDKLGGTLAAAKMQAEVGSEENFAKAIVLIDQALSDTREISHNMISGVLIHFGLIPALKDLKESLEVAGQFEIHLAYSDFPRLERNTEVQLFRIVQELVGNCIKHSQASTIWITLQNERCKIAISVEDNGRGYNTSQVATGLGLKNIQRRTSSLDGEIRVHSSDTGTNTTVKIPLTNEKHQSTIS